MGTKLAFVLSDLHLGPGGPLTTFHEPDRLAARLRSWRERAPFELVLAGDVFDFLQVDGYDGFSAAKGGERFECIAANPGTATVLTALGDLASTAGVELTVLAGNHDPEVLIDEVREAFARKIKRSIGSIRWADDDAPLVAAEGAHPAVHGRALAATDDADPSRAVWVVHGDRWDPSNHIDRRAVRDGAKAGTPVTLPVGSHLVFEVLSKLKRDHRWVDELKPELAVVLPLLVAIAPRLTMKFIVAHYNVASALIASRLRAALRQGPLFDASTATTGDTERVEQSVTATDDPISALVRSLEQTFRDLPASDRDVDGVVAALEVHLDRGQSPSSAALLAGPRGVFGFLLRAGLRAVRAADRFGQLDGPDATAKNARRYLPANLGALIAGHTHGARIRPDLRPPYFNTGTWVPVRTLPPGDLASWLDEVTDPAAQPAPSPGTFAWAELGDEAPRVAVWPPGAES